MNPVLLQWFNLVRCFCFGLSGAYDTLGSQAFGSGNKVSGAVPHAARCYLVIHLVNSFGSAHCPAGRL